MRAKKRLGQNFLVGTGYAERIVAAVNPVAEEPIIEIGPGEGALTSLLLSRGARVIAIEFDPDLIPLLERRFGSDRNLHLIGADALEVDYCSLLPAGGAARVVANLPYYISTPLLQRLIAHRRCLTEMTLMLQREVVERIAAAPGGRDYGYLSVLVQLHCEVTPLFDVPPGAFRPAPKVTSSVVRLRRLPQPAVELADESLFLALARTLFAQRRKTIFNNLRAGQPPDSRPLAAAEARALLDQAGLDGDRRAETLSLAEMARLANGFPRTG